MYFSGSRSVIFHCDRNYEILVTLGKYLNIIKLDTCQKQT